MSGRQVNDAHRAGAMREPRILTRVYFTSVIILLFVSFLAAIFPGAAVALTNKEIWSKSNAERLMIVPDVPPRLLDNGGPDSYGYYFYDTRDSSDNAPSYSWIDISHIGDTIHFSQDDQTLGSYPIGFFFNYYGQIYNTFRVCSNGWLSFGSASTAYLNRPIPTADDPNNLLAVFWDDLIPDSGSAYRYTNDLDTCIVSWNHFRHYPGSGDYTFEVILTRDGGIVFQYRQLIGVLDSHTIGIENSSGTAGLQYVFDSFKNETLTAIYFGLRPPHYVAHDVMPSSFRSPPARGLVGVSISPQVRFINAGGFTESFDGRVRIFHNGQLYDQVTRILGLHPDSSIQAFFPAFVPTEPGAYDLIATSELSTDLFPRNDTFSVSYFAYDSIYSINFEADSTSFSGNHDWQWGTATRGPSNAHSGTRLWGTILNGNYTVGPLLSTLYSATLFVADSAVLTFWQWYDTEALFDGGNAKISTDDGATWTILTPEAGYDGALSTSFQNPLGGQPAFYGVSGGWQMVTIDLSPYSGSVAIIRFDFGSDDSGVSTGWYIDDFSVLNGGTASPGWLTGVVSDTSGAPIRGALITAGQGSQYVDSLGSYFLELLPGIYAVTASAPYYNRATSGGIRIAAGDTATLDFILTSPALEINADPIDTSVVEGRYITLERQLTNTGNGPLDYNIRVSLQRGIRFIDNHGKIQSYAPGSADDPPIITDFGDEVLTFDPQTPTGDDGCVGVEFDGRYFWVTGRHGVDEFHKLHKFDRDGNLIASYEQNTRSLWGWRDLAFDGRYLYASDENELAVIDTANGQMVDTIPMPSSIPPPLRGLAYDPASHNFWAANFLSNIIEFDRSGQTINSFPNDHHVFGLAWDDASRDGPWLWVFSQDGAPPLEISQFDPRNGVYTGTNFTAIDHNGGEPDLAGGASFSTEWDQSKGIIFCLVMGRTTQFDSFDNVQGYEITPYPRWLSVTPASGTIAPSESQPLTIRLDFSDSSFVPDSLYQGMIRIENNSAYAPAIPVSVGVLSGINNDDGTLPREFALYHNYPNPFNSSTLIRFSLPQSSQVKLDIYNILGQKVTTLLDGNLHAGNYSIIWDGGHMASGVYFARLTADGISKMESMTLVK
jgi:hypothetical protein